jgi:acyl-CoA thioesterase FadM
MWDNKYSAVLGGGLTRYRRSLKLMQRYQVRTQLMHWDERWFFFEHAFLDARGRRIAVGISRAALRSGGADPRRPPQRSRRTAGRAMR